MYSILLSDYNCYNTYNYIHVQYRYIIAILMNLQFYLQTQLINLHMYVIIIITLHRQLTKPPYMYLVNTHTQTQLSHTNTIVGELLVNTA